MKFKILLCGDDCIDIYQYGSVTRLSPEAPVPIFNLLNYKKIPGMAGNVKRNLQNLSCIVDYKFTDTNIKTRMIDIKSGQHIIRIDDDKKCSELKINFDPNVYDAIVVSDYIKGTISYEFIEELRLRFTGPIFVDTKKKDLARFDGCIVKINDDEYSKIQSSPTELIVTMGKNGARYKDNIYTTPFVQVVDVCGAGDTFLAALCYYFLLTKDMNHAIIMANKAASITVQHLGVYAPNLSELK